MSDLRERFQEVADAAAREGRTPGAAAAIRRARQRQLRLAGGVASLLVVLLAAGALLVDRIVGGPDEPAPLPAVGPPSTQSLPGTGAVRTDQPPAGTPEHRLLEHMTAVLKGCRGGGAPELIGWVRAHGYVLMVAAKPPRPGEGWVCQVPGFLPPDGNPGVGPTERWVVKGLPPPPRKRLAAKGSTLGLPADRGMLAYAQGYASRQAARVRVQREGGRPPLVFGLVDPGDRFPVKFFMGLFPVTPAERFPFKVEALDQAGRVVARCTPGAPSVGDCRDV